MFSWWVNMNFVTQHKIQAVPSHSKVHHLWHTYVRPFHKNGSSQCLGHMCTHSDPDSMPSVLCPRAWSRQKWCYLGFYVRHNALLSLYMSLHCSCPQCSGHRECLAPTFVWASMDAALEIWMSRSLSIKSLLSPNWPRSHIDWRFVSGLEKGWWLLLLCW